MAAACSKKNRVSEVAVEYRPAGSRAVYLIETTSAEDTDQVQNIFSELSERYDVTPLCKGKLIGYCIQLAEPAEEMLNEVEELLRTTYPLVVSQKSFDEVVWNLVSGLSREAGSQLCDVPACDICGKVEPFPTVSATLLDDVGEAIITRHYCEKCSAGNAVTSNKEFLRSLLKSDKLEITGLENWELTRQTTQKNPMRFRVECIECEDGFAGVE